MAAQNVLYELPEELGPRLELLIERAGISQSETARRAQITQPYMNQIVRGKRVPHHGVAARIADALDVDRKLLTVFAPDGPDYFGGETAPYHAVFQHALSAAA